MTTTAESTFFERLKKHPELKARFEAILDVAEANSDGPDTADAVESRTLDEVRRLGNEVMTDWAKGKAEKSLIACKSESSCARTYKKKPFVGSLALEK